MAKNKPEENETVNESVTKNTEPEAAAEAEENAEVKAEPKAEGKVKKEIKTAKALAETMKKLTDAEKKLKEAEEKLAEAEKNAAADKDKYLRLYAEYDNYRKRSQKERETTYADGKTDAVTKLLPVYDNLSRALSQGTEDKAFLKGIEMTMTQLEGILKNLGVEPIEAVGQPFDASKHEAVMHKDDDSVGENIVVMEFEKGFTLGEKVIRYSKVVVAN